MSEEKEKTEKRNPAQEEKPQPDESGPEQEGERSPPSGDGRGVLKRIGAFFFAVIFVASMIFFGFVFGILAAVILPFYLPWKYLRGTLNRDLVSKIIG